MISDNKYKVRVMDIVDFFVAQGFSKCEYKNGNILATRQSLGLTFQFDINTLELVRIYGKLDIGASLIGHLQRIKKESESYRDLFVQFMKERVAVVGYIWIEEICDFLRDEEALRDMTV